MNYQSRLKQYKQYKFLVFIPAIKYIKYFQGTTQIYLLKSDGMPEESIENITKSVSNFAYLLIIIHYQT